MMSWICERAKRNQTTRKIQIEIHDPDKQADVITNIEPDILECDVTWALGNITTNKASGGDGIPAELFQILKDDAALNMPANLENFSSGHKTRKGQISFQSQRKAMPENAQTTEQSHSSHTLASNAQNSPSEIAM